MKKILANVKGKDLKPGDKVYDFALRKYDEIKYIEVPSQPTDSNQVYVTWVAFDDGFFKEDVKDFSTYLNCFNSFSLLIEVKDSAFTIDTAFSLIQRDDTIYIPQANEFVKITYISPKEGNRGEPLSVRTLEWINSKGEEKHELFDSRNIFTLMINADDLTQAENNHTTH